MKYAEVAVNAPGGHRHTFSYSIPDTLQVEVGCGVRVPFGPRVLQGIVVEVTDKPSFPDTRDVEQLISSSPIISSERIKLALWISDYYVSPIWSSIALFLPPAFERNTLIKPKSIKYLTLVPESERAKSLSAKQHAILELLSESGGRLPVPQILEQLHLGRSVIKTLLAKGLAIEDEIEVSRDPLARRDFPLELPFTFTDNQNLAWRPIVAAISDQDSTANPNLFLLHGVTGSGKTEIYLRALAETIKRSKKGICLVPEISLTTQIVNRFFARFPGRVAVFHSKLSLGEQYDEWRRIQGGDFDIVIGPRSAIFSPQPDLGLIIVDEEHEWAYKQSDQTPRYHARDVAVQLARLTGSTLIMGSATPDIETYYKAVKGEYQLIELKERITPLGSTSLPEVSIVNMRDEFKAGNRSIFSRLLKAQVKLALEQQEQVILFINRRGQSTFVECMNCGFVPSCKRCSGFLTYHSVEKRLICHHCRRAYPVLKTCPNCYSREIKYFGIGTETVETECSKLFPYARVLRFDSDTMSKAREYEKAMNSFRKRETDILVGTQILAKGLDFPGVSLVGIVNADSGLNLPDFRSGERTFQLLCQVEGRAGRGIVAGRAVIQTYNPGYYAIKYAALHDYGGFYESELSYRREFGYPPFTNMVRLVYSHVNEDKCRAEAGRLAANIQLIIDEQGVEGFKLVGPAPAFLSRLRGKYQVQLIILGGNVQNILEKVDFPLGWILDVDPVGMI
ncbi:MAG: primosomal protein N' [Dehalococcoidia bacterium]|jgi:primosomal protein N' (replication factor Y)